MNVVEEPMDDDIIDITEEVHLQQIKEQEEVLERKERLLSATKQERLYLEKKIENTLECRVCFHSYTKGERSPRYLGCHTLCDRCIYDSLEEKRGPIRQAEGLPRNNYPAVDINCPFCQRIVHFKKGLTELDCRRNLAILEIVTKLKDESKSNPANEPITNETSDATTTFDLLVAVDKTLTSELKWVKILKTIMEAALTCPLCQKRMDTTNEPIILRSCGHTICSKCLEGAFQDRKQHTNKKFWLIPCKMPSVCYYYTLGYNSLEFFKKKKNFELKNLQ